LGRFWRITIVHQGSRRTSGPSHQHESPLDNPTDQQTSRPWAKTQLKISGCHQSADGATAWLGVRSSLDSARKHGLSAFEAIHRAFTGNLWMPPIEQAT